MKKLDLSRGYVTILDDDDFEVFSQFKWHISSTGYAIRRPYIRGSGRKKQKCITIRLHREIIKAPEGFEVDHINGDRLDNRKVNLRLVSRKQNAANASARKNRTSFYKGVHRDHRAKKWQAQITIDGNSEYLGNYNHEMFAAIAYDNAAKKVFGEYAKLNFPDLGDAPLGLSITTEGAVPNSESSASGIKLSDSLVGCQ